jgi:hypothetical protein
VSVLSSLSLGGTRGRREGEGGRETRGRGRETRGRWREGDEREGGEEYTRRTIFTEDLSNDLLRQLEKRTDVVVAVPVGHDGASLYTIQKMKSASQENVIQERREKRTEAW